MGRGPRQRRAAAGRGAVPTEPSPGGESPGRGRWGVAWAVWTLLIVLETAPLFLGRVEPRWDARDLNYPAFVYLSDSLREGRLPLWDPYTACGYPYHADPLHPTLNPVAVLIGLLVPSGATGFCLYWTFHWWLGGAGMLRLCRGLGASPAGGLVAASAYAFSGFFVGLPQITPMIVSAGWLPWVIDLADRSVRRGNWGYAMLAGCALGISHLGGYPGLGGFTMLAVPLFLALRHLPPPDPGDRDVRPFRARLASVALTAALVAALSLAVFSPVLASFFSEGRGYTGRVEPIPPSSGGFGGDVLSPQAHFSVFFPRAAIDGKEWMGSDITMADAYVGALTIPLALLWFLRAPGRRRPWWLPAFFLFAWITALGPSAGLRTLLYYVWPPIRYVRYSAIFKLYGMLALAAGAGLGAALAAREGREAAKALLKLLLGFAGLAAAAGVAAALYFGARGGDVSAWLPGAALPAAAILPAGLVLAAAWARAQSPAMARAAPVLLAGLALLDGSLHLRGNAETVWVERDSIRQVEAYRRHGTTVAGEPGPRHPPMRFGYYNVQQVVKEPIVLGYVAMKSKGFEEVLCRSRFAEVLASPTRYWLAPGAEPVPPDDEALRELSAAGSASPAPAFAAVPATAAPPPRVVPGSFGTVRVLSYAPEEVEIDVVAPPPGPRFLLGTDRYAAGWKVFIDGARAEPVRSNLFFRGVAVPSGRHRVRWSYRPAAWIPLLALSGVTLLGGAAGAFVLIRRGRSRARGETAARKSP